MPCKYHAKYAFILVLTQFVFNYYKGKQYLDLKKGHGNTFSSVTERPILMFKKEITKASKCNLI